MRTLTTQDADRVVAISFVNRKTLTRYLKGQTVQGSSIERIHAALRELGLPIPDRRLYAVTEATSALVRGAHHAHELLVQLGDASEDIVAATQLLLDARSSLGLAYGRIVGVAAKNASE